MDTVIVGHTLGERSLAAMGACTSIYDLLVGFALGIGNGLMPLIFLIISSCLNIVLDLLFIRKFGMGVRGAAIRAGASERVSAARTGIMPA